MQQLRNYGDIRQTAFCTYCGRETETRDHVPSRVLLDPPYPENRPVVPSCRKCNESYSLDEEYVACLVECVVTGSVESSDINREKIKRTLEHTSELALRLNRACKKIAGGTFFTIETERVKNVFLKLARGHSAYELNEPQLCDPSSMAFAPLSLMASKVRKSFETPPVSPVLPEVGSRAIQRLAVDKPGFSLWINVQAGRYRYLTCADDRITVRTVLAEYLGCEVVWV